jgi:hypothetical protein
MNSIIGLDEMITEFSFGKIVVNGKTYTNDIKIVNGQVISEWWRQSGHRVAVEDMTDVLAAEPEVVVIGKGSPGLLKSTASLRDHLTANHIELIEKKTSVAIDVFNGLLQQGRKVAAGFHISC